MTIIASYAKSFVATCNETKIISGRSEGKLAPKDNITRDEVAPLFKNC
ncbi:S-layer homology domain-containing protein [Fusibacter bizertensis]